MSLAFVFGTMAEFALVLLVQRNLEQERTKLRQHYDGFDSENKVSPRSTSNVGALGRTAPHKEPGNWVEEMKMPNMSFCKRTLKKLRSLHSTTMIDIGAFLFFIITYAIFNIIYFISIK